MSILNGGNTHWADTGRPQANLGTIAHAVTPHKPPMKMSINHTEIRRYHDTAGHPYLRFALESWKAGKLESGETEKKKRASYKESPYDSFLWGELQLYFRELNIAI